MVQLLSFPNAPTGPELGEFQQVWGALSCQMLSCSIANPGLREESQAIADSWVVTAA